jgi:predicted nucleic acid-binding protein
MARRSLRARQQPAAYLPPALVLDCPVAVAWYLEDEGSDFTDGLLHAIPKLEIWVPAIWMLEFSNALFAAQRRRRISAAGRTQILAQASLLPLSVDPHCMLLREADAISAQHDLTPYDAAYFELARRRKLPLATLDAALVKAARAARLPLLTDLSVFPN